MKAVLISIRPEWCEKIASGQKTIEVRKTRPKIETPFKCYIYCTKPNTTNPHEYLEIHADDKIHKANGKVIAEFVCDKIIKAERGEYVKIPANERAMKAYELMDYADEKTVYGWHISDLVIYDKPKELNEFVKPGFIKYGEMDPEELCPYCADTDYGEKAFYGTPNGPVFCEGEYCDRAYQGYLDDEGFTLYRPPQSWCYVEEICNI